MTPDAPLVLIDDSPDDRFFLRRLLRRSAAEYPRVIEFETCEQALEFLEEQPAACCLVDYQLPGMDGLDFLRSLRQSTQTELLPVVVMTGQGDEALAVSMLQSGAQDYLVKGDISAEKLYRAIKTAVTSCELQRQLHFLAHHDALTGLLNRSLFMDRLQQMIDQSERHGHKCALLYIDVDSFKQVNDSLGHEAGDFLLQTVAQRLSQNCRKTDSPARLGGDEFVVLLDRVEGDTAEHIARKVLSALEQPIMFQQHAIRASASIGVALYPDTARSAKDLLKQADQAMYLAKRSGRAQWIQFSPEQSPEWQRRDELETALPEALDSGALRLELQPVVELASGDLARLRVLSCWPHANHALGHVELMQLIERQGLVERFLEWWLDALGAHSVLSAGGAPVLQVPADLFAQMPLAEKLLGGMRTAGFGPESWLPEFTEGALLRHPEQSEKLLIAFAHYGINAALGNVGMGYSSLGWLARLPLQGLVLDPGLLEQRRAAAAVAAIGHELGLQVAAGGIDSAAMAACAHEAGCDLGFGHHWQWRDGEAQRLG